jgi:hypothetical protein
MGVRRERVGQTYLKGLQGAKGTYAALSDDFKFGILPELLQEWPGAGVALATAYRKLGAAGAWTKQGIAEGQLAGIISPSVDAAHPNTMRPANIVDIAGFRSNLLERFAKNLKPYLDRTYGEDLGAKQAAIQRILGDQNAVNLIDKFLTQSDVKLLKDQGLWHKGTLDMPPGWEESVLAFQKKWEGLMVALGLPQLGTATNALKAITNAMSGSRVGSTITPSGQEFGGDGGGRWRVCHGCRRHGGWRVDCRVHARRRRCCGAGRSDRCACGARSVELGRDQGGLESWRTPDWNKIIYDALANVLIAFKDWVSNLGSQIVDAIKGMWENMKAVMAPNFLQPGVIPAAVVAVASPMRATYRAAAAGDMMGAIESSPALRRYLDTGGHGLNPQTTAWCAAYVGSWSNHHGYASLSSNVATSYLNYGTAEMGPVQAGDVVVTGRHGTRPLPGHLGHVGIATGRVSGDRIEIIAGNYGNRVGREWERRGSVVIRHPPPKHEAPPARQQVVENGS